MKSAADLTQRWKRASRRVRWLCIVFLVLIAVRLVLPYGIKTYVNHQLNHSQDYAGRIRAVDLKLWRGMYRIRNAEIFKKSGGVPDPLFAAARVDLSVEWKELFHGAVVGEVTMWQPRLNFVSGPTAGETQTGKDEQWDKILESLFPFKLNRFEIKDAQIHFQNHHSTPPVDIFLTQVSATATNLTNSREVKDGLPAGVNVRGATPGGGGLEVRLQLNPMTSPPAYQLTCQLTNVDLTQLNSFLKAYGKFDVERGKFALYTSVAAKDGNYDGYLKVFFENLDVFAWEKERQKNALEVFWQAIVGTVTTVLKNQRTDQLATRIPISGSYDGNKIGVWMAAGTLLRNAFIRALIPKLDESITVGEVEKKSETAGQKNRTAVPRPATRKVRNN